jgi:hypothetical protein
LAAKKARFCRGFCDFHRAKRGEVRGKSWWICGESVVGNTIKSITEKYANF